jgi:hypothetical protein
MELAIALILLCVGLMLERAPRASVQVRSRDRRGR